MSGLAGWLRATFGRSPADQALFERALNHSSAGRDSYERLEFLGDRVLGLVMARWLYERFPGEPEGDLSRRYNALVARETCAAVGRMIGVPERIRLGRQAREDGASDSDNVIGDVVEALLGALLIDAGLDAAESFIRGAWGGCLDEQALAPQHPKSELQEWAAASGLATPCYRVTARSGPHHAPMFTVAVTIPGAGEAEAQGSSKQEAETAAATALLAILQSAPRAKRGSAAAAKGKSE